MWKCKHCAEQVENTFDSCWKCGCGRDGLPPKETTVVSEEAVLPNGELLSRLVASQPKSEKNEVTQALISHYIDAYGSARWLVRFGSIFKWSSFVLAGMIFALGALVSAGNGSPLFLFGGVILGASIGMPNFLLGMLIAGQGNTQMATLDTAVNTSRHLNKDDIVKIMFH